MYGFQYLGRRVGREQLFTLKQSLEGYRYYQKLILELIRRRHV